LEVVLEVVWKVYVSFWISKFYYLSKLLLG